MKRAPSRIMSISDSNTSVQPYLFFGGRCEEARIFIATRRCRGSNAHAFQGEPGAARAARLFRRQNHACNRPNRQTTLMASDGQCEGKPSFEGFALSITVPNETEAERSLLRWVKVVDYHAAGKTFWTAKFGMLQDRFGVTWMVSVEHKPGPGASFTRG